MHLSIVVALFLFLIDKFIFIEYEKKKDEKTGKTKIQENLIFPRYHQLDAIRNLIEDITNFFIIWSNMEKKYIDYALEKLKDGFVVINEISDNPGSGCPGDGTYTLKAMLDRDLPGTIFQYIKDPEVAKQAHEAGVGAKIDIVIGGKTDDMHGKPIEVKDVEVLALSDGIFDYRTPNNKGLVCNLGLSARLRHSNVEFIVVTARVQALDDGMIYATGGDPKNYKIIALKSANHFRGYFEPIADAIVTSDPPGIRCSNLTTYPYKRMRSPLYPLDRDTKFDI